MQGEYCTTQVCGPVVLVGAKICSWSPEKIYSTPLLISKFRSVMSVDPES